ncbi:MAG TPA: hypothetical protein G4O13_08835 [Dehalococcoidia bacterium]|nr:hypothetical protein [Dehalococcoidia bacterium]
MGLDISDDKIAIAEPNAAEYALTDMNAAYTISKIKEMLLQTQLQGWSVSKNFIGLVIAGQKPPA